ncbi:MAG: hypothetical protein NTU44_16770 [Bacteroidetes bacterium]|nr:hypothetical protein [Bacteroidota bacterium]
MAEGNDHYDHLVLIRHDVDKLPKYSLRTARIEYELGIRGTCYFRTVPESYDEKIMREIAEMGHEVGYHYETMDEIRHKAEYKRQSAVGSKQSAVGSRQSAVSSQQNDYYNKMIDEAYALFVTNLDKMRKVVPISTICMHGSPLSKYDNRDIWKKYNYRDLGIIAEPYFDIDFTKVFYLTDTGRRWDGEKVSVRDKVTRPKAEGRRQKAEGKEEVQKENATLHNVHNNHNGHNLSFHSTKDIIKSIEKGTFPHQVMITVHPQRWTNDPVPWTKELVLQNVKNVVKRVLIAGKTM